ncbi:MAG TPA: hypothetical protein VL201_04665 [Patescibacteria group bacterium]|jgi:hypothetical protein|nr:hypothetical protein [Patescibacteria group bacterium]
MLLKIITFIFCLSGIITGSTNNVVDQDIPQISIKNVYSYNSDGSNIFALKGTKHSQREYDWNNLKNFPGATEKINRSLFFHLCGVFNYYGYEPKVGYAFLDEEIVCLIEKPTYKHIADLVQKCDINIPPFFDSVSVKKEIIDLLLLSYEFERLTRPYDVVRWWRVDVNNSTDYFGALSYVMPFDMHLIKTRTYKNGLNKWYGNAKKGYKKSFYGWFALTIILVFVNKIFKVKSIFYNYGLTLFFTYNAFSPIYFSRKLDMAYNNLEKGMIAYEEFAERYNTTITNNIALKKQHVNSEMRFEQHNRNEQWFTSKYLSFRQDQNFDNKPSITLPDDFREDAFFG